MKFLLLLVTLTTCAASPQDLTGKMFTFPQQSKTAQARLSTTTEELRAITLCHRSFTDLRRDHAIFSMATRSNPNAFLIFWDQANLELEPHIKDQKTEFRGLDYKPNAWHSVCTTWDSTTALVQMWFDGRPSIKKFVNAASVMRGSTIIILGQEQDSHGGGFDINQSFVGMMSDVHMWDYVLSSCEIHKYTNDLDFIPGNVLNWKALEVEITGKVLIEDKPERCP